MSGTYLSLFSGIGGLDLAAEAHGFTCVGQVEWDAACSAVLERWWPGVPRWGDVTEFTAAAYAESGGSPDLIIGGFPCQPFSHAGKRGGKSDDRYLWPEFARIVRELRPRLVLIENVPGLLTLRRPMGDGSDDIDWAFGDVLRDLAEDGFDARWVCLRASDVGAPHRRERVFILAQRADSDGIGLGMGRPGTLTSGDRGEPQPRAGGLGAAAADAQDADGWPGVSLEQGEAWERGSGPGGFGWGPYEPAIRRWERVMGPAPAPVDDKGRLAPPFVEWMMGFPSGWTDGMTRTNALKALGNAVVPQQGAIALGALL